MKYNYGTQQQVFAKKPADAEMFALLENDDLHNDMRNGGAIVGNKCMCGKCQKVFDLTIDGKGTTNLFRNNASSFKMSRTLTVNGESFGPNDTVKCPDCGNEAELTFAIKNTETNCLNWNLPNNKQSKNGWSIPRQYTGRYIFVHENNGKPTRVDDNFMFSDTIVYPSYKTYTSKLEMSDSMDFLRKSCKLTRTLINGDVRTVDKTSDAYETYHFKDDTYLDTKTVSAKNFEHNLIDSVEPSLFHQTAWYSSKGLRTPIQNNPDASKDTDKINRMKLKYIGAQFSRFQDLISTGLFAKEHHPNQDYDVTPLDSKLLGTYGTMLVKYPAAVEYAIERVGEREKNFAFKEARQAKQAQDEGKDYTERELTTSAKNKMFREEMKYVASQLMACDDKILDKIAAAKDVKEMKESLAFFALGKTGPDGKVPSGLSVKNADEIKSDPNNSNTLEKMFNADPIAVASNSYTLHKIGIKNPTHVFEMMKFASDCPNINPKAKRDGSKPYIEYLTTKNVGILAPVQRKDELRFLRLYANTHQETDVMDIFKDPQKFSTMVETVKLFGPLADNPNIVLTADKEDIKEQTADDFKTVIKNYLEHNSLSQGYIDFAEQLKDKTKDTLDSVAREILHDKELDEAKKCLDENGFDAVKAKYPKLAEEDSNLEQTLNEWVYLKDRPPVIKTRNAKPLFPNRNINEIHDELSHIAQNYTGENKVIEYTDKELEFEKSYPVPDEFRGPDTPEDAKWSFHLMKDTFDAVRTAQALENCAAGQSYIDGAVKKSLYLMYMENENGERVAEIEIRKAPGTGYNGSIRQFQAKNDRSLDGRYKDVALQWISDCELKDDCSCDDINKFGQNVVFHGTGETDYHNDEIDEVTLARITKEENKKRNERRIKAAAELYGTDASGNILKPEIPDDLLSFK